jgi:hypothetical protein
LVHEFVLLQSDFINFREEQTEKAAEVEDFRDTLDDRLHLKETLPDDHIQILLVQHPHLFEVLTPLQFFDQQSPLSFQNITLEVRVEVIDQETHMQAQLHSMFVVRLGAELLESSDTGGPDVLEIQLGPLYRKEEPE